MTFQEQVQRDAAIPDAAFKVMPLVEAMKAKNAIVFIYARWSGTSTHAWRTLTATLATVERLPAVIVVDADEIQPHIASELIGTLPQGKGETLWIKDGIAIGKLSGYRQDATSTILQYSQSLEE
jgi:hypothetical protein